MSGRRIGISIFYELYINLQATLSKVFFESSLTSSIKTLSARSFGGGVVPFFVGTSLPGLATVSVLLFEKEEYFHSTGVVSGSRGFMGGLLVSAGLRCGGVGVLLAWC